MVLLDCIVNLSSFIAFDASGNLYIMIRSNDLNGGANDTVKFLKEVQGTPIPSHILENVLNALSFQSAENVAADITIVNTCILDDTILNTTVDTLFP